MSEWWLQDGRAVHADGDVGDMNHEAYVVEHVSGIFLRYMKIPMEHMEHVGSLAELDAPVSAWLQEHGVPEDEARNDPMSAMGVLLPSRMVPLYFKTVEQFEEALAIAYCSGRQRAADYAQRYEGWKRVAGCWVETWTFTREDLKSIADGLSDACGDEVPEGSTFNIEVRATRTEYRDIPWSVLDNTKNPADLREYATRHRVPC